MTIYTDSKFDFVEVFDHNSGFYLRSEILTEDGIKTIRKTKYTNFEILLKDIKRFSTGREPLMRSMPSMIDVGIMGHCLHGSSGLCKVGCYQSGGFKSRPNMTLKDFSSLAEQSRGIVQQFALGGRGDPNMHEEFGEILKTSRNNNIVPNYTTSGLVLTDKMVGLTKDYCGAVAVSWYNEAEDGHTRNAIRKFLSMGVKTNIHYVLSKSSIKDAENKIITGGFPEGVNAVVFLLYKPVGQGKKDNVLTPEEIKPFLESIGKSMSNNSLKHAVGFDSCCVPFILKHTKDIHPDTVISCDAGLFSMYVSDQMTAMPCSFDQERKYGVNLRTHSLNEVWESPQFDAVREIQLTKDSKKECENCSNKGLCKTCPLMPDLNYCQ